MITVILIVAVLFFALLLAAWFWCFRTARKLLHPAVSRAALSVCPDQYKLPYENIYFNTQDNVQIKGWFIPHPDSEKTIIFMPGWQHGRAELLKHTCFLYDFGYNLMYIDLRGQGESGGADRSVGYLELKDLQAAVEFVKNTRPFSAQKIGLYGFGVGGAVSVCEASQNPDIRCAAVEGAYYSFRRLVTHWVWTHGKIPYFPVVPLVLHHLRKKLDMDLERYSPRYNIAGISPRAVFIIHGREDERVPASSAQLLFKHAKDPKEIWLVPGAHHDDCAAAGGFEYKQRLLNFFRTYL